MTKLIVGVDISKSTFDVAIPIENVAKPKHLKYSNDKQGFRKFVKDIPIASHVLMEASGCYYLQLATYLYENGYDVSVINPLSMSLFTKMRMHRSKTDKKDAGYIAEYGVNQRSQLKLWKPKAEYILELQQLEALLENFTAQRAKLKNIREAFTCSGSLIKAP